MDSSWSLGPSYEVVCIEENTLWLSWQNLQLIELQELDQRQLRPQALVGAHLMQTCIIWSCPSALLPLPFYSLHTSLPCSTFETRDFVNLLIPYSGAIIAWNSVGVCDIYTYINGWYGLIVLCIDFLTKRSELFSCYCTVAAIF